MIRSKRSHEGYLIIDNSASPGISEEFARQVGYKGPIVGEGEVFEAPTLICSHCSGFVMVNPDRVRAREYCRKCDHYICDLCAAAAHASGECNSQARRFDQIQNTAVKAGF